MADTTQYRNKYRGYLEDDADTYLSPEMDPTAKVIMGGIATVGLVAGGYLAFKKGALKDVMHSTIAKAGSFRRGKTIAMNDAVRKWSQDDRMDELGNAVMNLMKGKPKESKKSAKEFLDVMRDFKRHKDGALQEHADRVARMKESQLRDREIEIKTEMASHKAMQERFRKDNNDEKAVQRVSKLFDQTIFDRRNLDKKLEKARELQTGFRHATINDLIRLGEINEAEDWVQEGITISTREFMKKAQGDAALKKAEEDGRRHFLNKVADNSILIDKKDKIADLRDFRDTFEGMVHSLTTDFTIPLVKINPLRMFYMDHFFTDKSKPLFHVATSDTKNPIVTGHNGAQGKPIVFADGKLFDVMHKDEAGNMVTKQIDGDYFLADAQKGPVARLLRNMSGISISEFSKPEANAPFIKKAKYHLGSFFDVGFQDEPGGQLDLLDPTSWGTSLINTVTGKFRQSEYVKRMDYLSNAFGKDKDFIYMRRHMDLKDAPSYKDYLNQFRAGRDNMDEVTMSTMFGYGFFERLNATLNQVNLGLSNKALGSAYDVFEGLLLKRVAPIWAGMELWDYMNYESENLLGFQFEDRFAQMYANSSVEIAKVRDNLGITDWAKGVAPLLVGGSELAEVPILGNLLDWNDTAEETQDYWENGEVAVRKGRWWQLGNTPYIGGKTEYYQPNWVRRTLADVKFSESQYGSREEYYANSWMPSLRHPFAPIKHFFTDQYHWEEKHYQDRPYMITGGIPEIENFPLIGPILNSTIGQLLKPQRQMHLENWNGDVQGMPLPVPPETLEYAQQRTVPMTFDNDGNASFGFASNEDSETDEDGNAEIDPGASVPILTQGAAYNMLPPETKEQNQALQEKLFSYITAGGQVQLLRGDPGATVWDATAVMDTKAPMSTGLFKQERLPMNKDKVETGAPLETDVQLHQMLGNLHYNMTEMGGFYGFITTSIFGQVGNSNPILQSSSDLSSYTRAFWDNDIGGFGGDANEIFRRFLPSETFEHKQNEINPVANTMPDWLPGSDYFVNFQTGDPYIKVKKGESRLPGEGYERLYNIDSEKMMKLDVGASFIGYDEQQIRDHMLKRDAYKAEAFNKILKAGTKIHEQVEKDLLAKGVADASEEYVKDEATGIGGFFDLYANNTKLLDWALQQNVAEFKFYQTPREESGREPSEALGGFYEEVDVLNDMDDTQRQSFLEQFVDVYGQESATVDIKTRGAKAFAKEGMHFENVQQLNFYAKQKGTRMNYFIELNRDNPDAGIKIFAFQQSDDLLNYTTDKVMRVREGIRQDMESGKLHRGDLYDPIDRFRILADVAPYSQEYRDMKGQLSNMNLDEDDMKEAQEIKKQVSERKHKYRFYDYRFKTANVDEKMVTVDHVIDSNTFVSMEFPDNPIRLAGVRVSTAKDNPIADEAARVIGQTIKEGSKIRIQYDADEQNQIKDDTYKTLQAVVYDHKGRNLNKYLIDNELAKEKENDYSAAAVHARFTPGEIKFGSMWESFAHMDTILHTKLLQVRSPLESYERREVYGKDWQEWTDPIEDFLIPAIQSSAIHNPVVAIGGGAIAGMMFGSLKPSDIGGEKVIGRYGKIVGGFIGASVMGIAVLNRMITEAVTGEAWIPERRQKERDTEEYFDVLEYIKYNALYDQYSKKALKEEGINVESYLSNEKFEGDKRKQDKTALQEIKKELYRSRANQVGPLINKLREQYGIEAETKEEAMKAINKEITSLTTHREIKELSPIAAKAIMYKQAAKQTMYGYEAGDPIANILSALPKKDREYLTPFIKAPEEERQRILDIVPNYMKRVLQSAWGLDVDEKTPLKDYFKKHALPGANWEGWRENVSLDDIKVKFVDRVGLDPSEFNIWENDKQRADRLNVPTPDVFNGRESAEEYSRKLKEILTGSNIHGLNIDIIESDKPGTHINMNIAHDRRDDVQKIINRDGHYML